MKKLALFITILFLITSCKQEDKNKIERQIISYQKQVNALTTKISGLQTQLQEQNTAKKQQTALRVSVKTKIIKPTLFKHFFDASAEIESIHEAYISSEISGQIVRILVNEGDLVKKGQLLAQLETDMVEDNIREIKTSLTLAEFTYQKQKKLWGKHIGSKLQYLQAKTNLESLQNKLQSLQTQYDKSFIKAPIGGYVDAIDLKKGELAIPGVRFFHIVSLNNMYVNAQISETYLPAIHKGDWVGIKIPTYPKIQLHEKVYRVGNVINKQDRTFEIQFKIKNPDQLLKPNMLAILHINDYTREKALVAPSFVIRKDIQGYFLYLVKDEKGMPVAVKRYIKIGKSSYNITEVTQGLKPGDVIITEGYNNVSDGTPLDILN